MAAPAIGDVVAVMVTGVVTKTDSFRGDQFLVEIHRPEMFAPTRRQLWVVEDELESAEAPAAETATAGIPGTWGPDGCVPPADQLAAGGVTAIPDTQWTSNQFMVCGDGNPICWSGADWVGGIAP